MLKIGDFSKLSRVSVPTLRYYDQCGLLKPAHLDKFTGYRYYTASQLGRLYRILALKDLGFSLDQIGELLDKDLSISELRGMFMLRQAQVQQLIEGEQARLDCIVASLQQLEREDSPGMSNYDIVLKDIPPMLVASVRQTIPDHNSYGLPYGKLWPYVRAKQARISQPDFIIYHDREYKERDIDVECAVPLDAPIDPNDDVRVYTLPGYQVVSTVHQGFYTNIHEAFRAVYTWIQDHGYETTDPDRQVNVHYDAANQANNVTEVQFPVKKI